MSVYDDEAFSERVNYAVTCILRGTDSRHFDTCFEMDDGDAVCVAVYRRSLLNPRLAEKIWTKLNQQSVMAQVEQMKAIATNKLKDEARRLREVSHAVRTEETKKRRAYDARTVGQKLSELGGDVPE